MKKLERIDSIILALNYKMPRDMIQTERFKLMKHGYKFSNIWTIISSFKTEEDFIDKIKGLVRSEKLERCKELANYILLNRKCKDISITHMYYADCKEYHDYEVQAMKDLLLFIRNGNTDVYYLINEKIIDELSPHLHQFN